MAQTILTEAKVRKNDEYYTQLNDVNMEMQYYRDFFKGKKVLCNCNDDKWSAFFQYFSKNFDTLGLAKLTCISHNENGHGNKYVFTGDKNGNRKVDDDEIEVTELQGNGDFRSEESIAELQDCDVVVTNPPFSLFRDFVALLTKYNKKFLIIGNLNAITYKETFPLIKANKMWLGATRFNGGATYFELPKELYDPALLSDPKHAYEKDGKIYSRVNGVRWYTNIDHGTRHEVLELTKRYSNEYYPKYDNYDAIEVGKTVDIPMDYDGVMGVPISFLDKYNPDQFEIVKFRKGDDDKDLAVNGKCPYFRILIRHKK